jgi:hypothetical protein
MAECSATYHQTIHILPSRNKVTDFFCVCGTNALFGKSGNDKRLLMSVSAAVMLHASRLPLQALSVLRYILVIEQMIQDA